MKKFELQQFPNGRWGVILTGVTAEGGYVDTTFEDTLDEALDWIRERGQNRRPTPWTPSSKD